MTDAPKQQMQIARIQFLKRHQLPWPKANTAHPKADVSKGSDSDAAKRIAKRKAVLYLPSIPGTAQSVSGSKRFA
jgi:hypothetical protein